jgi:hypothetical protein
MWNVEAKVIPVIIGVSSTRADMFRDWLLEDAEPTSQAILCMGRGVFLF